MAQFCIKWAVLASVGFFWQVSPPPSDFVPDGDRKFWVPPIKNLEKKPCGPGADLEGAPPLILAKTGDTPPIFAETGRLTEGTQAPPLFFLKTVCAPLLKIPGFAPAYTNLIVHKLQTSQIVS